MIEEKDKNCMNCGYLRYLKRCGEEKCHHASSCVRLDAERYFDYWREEVVEVPSFEYDPINHAWDLALGGYSTDEPEHLYISICNRGVRLTTSQALIDIAVDWSKMKGWKPNEEKTED